MFKVGDRVRMRLEPDDLMVAAFQDKPATITVVVDDQLKGVRPFYKVEFDQELFPNVPYNYNQWLWGENEMVLAVNGVEAMIKCLE